MLQFYVWIFFGHLRGYLSPQARGLQHIGFIYRDESLTPAFSQLEADPDNALDFLFGVGHGVNGSPAAGCRVLSLGFAEIETAGELTDKD